jgi:5'-methylthioadenosine phosphorylase
VSEDRRGASIAVIGGSGLYALAAAAEIEEVRMDTPFGTPSDVIRVATLAGQRVAFLARHGSGHRLAPSEINYPANIFALKRLGVERILSASAVGSMREAIHPREVVLVDQFIDRAPHRRATFFGGGLVAHVAFAEPICPTLRVTLLAAARDEGARAHDGGTYLCMEGPAFSTRAESRLYRTWGVDVIGMTNLHEAKLAREAEICYATLALVTDYDCWHETEADVSVADVLGNLKANAELAARVLRTAIERLAAVGRQGCGCGDALGHALLTSWDAVPPQTIERLLPIVGRYLPPELRRR